jgi:hypothetical protein
MKLYVYCLAGGVEMLDEPVTGISGAAVRLLKANNLSVLVSDVDADSVAVTRDNALAHAAVVRSLLNRTTPLPFRFGTLVTEQQLRSYLSARAPALDDKLAQVRGCVEMSVKIIWEISEKHPPAPPQTDPEQGAGTTFLTEKRRQILGDERRAAEAAELATWLHQQVGRMVRDERVTLRPAEKLVLAAAHLVERAEIVAYREKMLEARQYRPDLRFLLSGPWPPYSFANIDLEFKTQFGVS